MFAREVVPPLLATQPNRPEGSIATENGEAPVPAEFTKCRAPALSILYARSALPLNTPTSRNFPRISAASERESPRLLSPPAIEARAPVAWLIENADTDPESCATYA